MLLIVHSRGKSGIILKRNFIFKAWKMSVQGILVQVIRCSENLYIKSGIRNNRSHREMWEHGLREGGKKRKSHLFLGHHNYPPYSQSLLYPTTKLIILKIILKCHSIAQIPFKSFSLKMKSNCLPMAFNCLPMAFKIWDTQLHLNFT